MSSSLTKTLTQPWLQLSELPGGARGDALDDGGARGIRSLAHDGRGRRARQVRLGRAHAQPASGLRPPGLRPQASGLRPQAPGRGSAQRAHASSAAHHVGIGALLGRERRDGQGLPDLRDSRARNQAQGARCHVPPHFTPSHSFARRPRKSSLGERGEEETELRNLRVSAPVIPISLCFDLASTLI